MKDYTSAQIAMLERMRDQLSDPAARAALDAAVAAIRETVAGTAEPAQQITQLDIGDDANIAVAVGGSVSGGVQSGGTRYQAETQVFFQGSRSSKAGRARRERLQAYLDTVIWRCDRLRLAGIVNAERKLGKPPAFRLSQLYVLLASTSWVADPDDDTAALSALPAGAAEQRLPEYARRLVTLDAPTPQLRIERPLLLLEALCQRRHMVLLGGPGSGKSAFLRYVAVMLARNELNNGAEALPFWSVGRLVPIYISLGGFAEWLRTKQASATKDQLWQYLGEALESPALGRPEKSQRQLFNASRLLLLFDGLDEVIDPLIRVQVAQAIADLTNQHPCYAVVSCRVRSYIGATAAPLIEWGDPVEIAPFTIGQIHHFIHGWYRCAFQQGSLEEHEAQMRADMLCQRLEALPNVRELGQTPLLLTLIVILHYYGGKLPEDRADLYEDLVQLLLTRWTQFRRDGSEQANLLELLKNDPQLMLLKEHHIRKVLEELAYRAHHGERSADGRGLLAAEVVRGALLQLFVQFGVAPAAAYEKTDQVLSYLEQESGLLLNEGGERYAMPHLTYEEYLAGCYLAKQKHKPDFYSLAYQHWQTDGPRWREVILLALGRMVRGDDVETAALWLQFMLVQHANLACSDPARLRALLFVAECLEDMGGKPALIGVQTVALPRLWAELAQGLAESITASDLDTGERVRAGAYVGMLGDPRPGVCDLAITVAEFTGGTFLIGNRWREHRVLERTFAEHWLKDTRNNSNLNLPAFALARYPVTIAQFALFAESGGYTPNAEWWDASGAEWLRSAGSSTHWHDRQGGRQANHPVVDVSWYEAQAFCRWLSLHQEYTPAGYRYVLPSEAEWEFAARGLARRSFPWGNEPPDAARANFGGLYQGTTAVGCFPQGATPEGVYDLAGNAWEWTRSVAADYPYEMSAERENPQQPADHSFIVRGGGWTNLAPDLHASFRHRCTPDTHYSGLGFRVARVPLS